MTPNTRKTNLNEVVANETSKNFALRCTNTNESIWARFEMESMFQLVECRLFAPNPCNIYFNCRFRHPSFSTVFFVKVIIHRTELKNPKNFFFSSIERQMFQHFLLWVKYSWICINGFCACTRVCMRYRTECAVRALSSYHSSLMLMDSICCTISTGNLLQHSKLSPPFPPHLAKYCCRLFQTKTTITIFKNSCAAIHSSANNSLPLSLSRFRIFRFDIFRLSLKTVDDANDLIWLGPKGESVCMSCMYVRWAGETSAKSENCTQPRWENVSERASKNFCQMQNQIKMEFINININRFTSKLIAPVNASNGLHSARTSDAVMS